MTEIDTLRELLQANGITKTFSDQTLAAILTQARMLVDAPYTSNKEYEDYVHNYNGTTYITQQYPVLKSGVTVKIDEVPQNNLVQKITNTGIIYFKRQVYGRLTVTYTVGLPQEDVNNYIIPIALEIIKNNEGRNVSSISEGDVSISYNNTNGETIGIDSLIRNLKNKYGARVRLI